MAYYIEDQLTGNVLGQRRPTINEYFLSSYTMAVYDGCEFGCPYCDGWAYRVRPFNETIRIGIDLPERLNQELGHLDRGDMVGITALTDPYQLAEKNYRLTRQVLMLFAERGQACMILTKSNMVLEDLVLLERIHQQSMAMVVFTIVTTDSYLSSKLEDKSPPVQLRLEAITRLKEAGIPVGVAFLPVIPYVNDTDYVLNGTIRAVAEAGADFLMWDYLHIPSDRHRERIGDMLKRIGSYPPSYYRELYGNDPLPTASYRAQRDRDIMALCDTYNLPVRAPHALYQGRLKPANEAALLLRHEAFRDAVHGRIHMAHFGRDLAERVYNGVATPNDIRTSSLYPTLQRILGYNASS